MAPASSNPGPYSLPDKDEVQLSAEDDWTRVKDRKEKKRIQNRVAQRSYRSRMKARLGELQSRLQAHEEQKAKEEAERCDPSPPSPPSSSATGLHLHTTPPSGNNAGANDTEPSSINSASPPTPPDVVGDLDPSQHAKAIDQFSHQMDMAGNDDSQWFLDSTSLLQHGDTSSYIQPSVPTPPVSLSQCPPMPAYMPEGPRNPNDGPASLSQSILQDCLRFQIQLLAKINNPSEATSTTHKEEGSAAKSPGALQQSHWSSCATNPAAAAQNMMPSTNMARGNSFSVLPADFHNLDDMMELTSTGDLPNATWRPSQQFSGPETTPRSHNAENPTQQQSPINDDTPSTTQHGAVPDCYNAFVAKSSAQASSLGMEERLEAAIEGLEALGFTSVDSFAEAYYSSSFDESSHLAAEQSMSRKRRLPRMLSQILDSAQSWDPWDRRGLNEEVLRTAESLLVAEGKSMDEKSLEASISGLMQATEGSSKPTPPQQNVTGMKRVLQNELPNLWPVMMALAGGNRASRQRDRSNMVLAAILILHCSSKMTKQKLLEFLDVCL
ncbi:basic-leucine zipper (bZIP) transcription factor [Purpureocillium lilacinum]|uniref:Transcription factor lcsF n=1 Tax=Purpureocillium lilacinum TaxID=33203 RepID=LCSF_PURLI|nr:RecName: Full=Transcription factor lcsF; AltName: Full=Leucinostatins biosynthesis cluster protein F [Purpureocillium lilacinum]OAQ83764.1 basic-leucine zipper (bZIP) transcription factor [Purpureocillium lilacinum]